MGQHVKSFEEFHNLNDLNEVKKPKARISKALLQATDRYHDAQLELQRLQKEFIATPKEDVLKREKLKKEILAAREEVRKTEKEFQATLGAEEIDDIEIIW